MLDLLAISRMLCSVAFSANLGYSVADCAPAGNKEKEARKEVDLRPQFSAGSAGPAGVAQAFDLGPGPEGAVDGCAAGRGVCSLRLSPLPRTLGLFRRRRRRGGLRDGESVFSRRAVTTWPQARPLACEAGQWPASLGLWPSWCDTGGLPSLASSRPQPVPREQTTWSTALSRLDGP